MTGNLIRGCLDTPNEPHEILVHLWDDVVNAIKLYILVDCFCFWSKICMHLLVFWYGNAFIMQSSRMRHYPTISRAHTNHPWYNLICMFRYAWESKQTQHWISHCGKVLFVCNITPTAQWVRWRLKLPALLLFSQPCIQAKIKENITAPRYWPLWREYTGDR